MHIVRIHNLTQPLSDPITAEYCVSFWARFRGLMLRQSLKEDEGILLVEKTDSRWDTAIHMFFMNFDIAAVWIDSSNSIVDVKLARKWRPYYIPAKPARFVLETHVRQLDHFRIGDQVELTHA